MLNNLCAGAWSNPTERRPSSTAVDENFQHASLIFGNGRKMRMLKKQAELCYSQVWYELLQVKSKKRIHKVQGANNLMCRIFQGFYLFCFVSVFLLHFPLKHLNSQRQNCWVKHSMCSAPVTELVCYQPPSLSRLCYHFQKGLE